MNSDSFIFYRSFYEAVKKIPKGEREELYEAIFEYALNGECYTGDNGVAGMVLEFVRPQIDANIQRRMNGMKGAEAGKKGGRPIKPQEDPKKTPNKPQENPKQTPNVNVNDNVECLNDNGNVDKEKDNTSIIPKEKKEQTAEFREALINLGVDTDIADEFMLIRKKKKAINTKHAFEMMLAEANKAGITLAEAVKICVDNQWKGFKAEYLQGLRERNSRGGGRGHTLEEMARIVDAGIALNDILGTRNEKERRGETWNSTGR